MKRFLTNAILALLIAAALFVIVSSMRGCGEQGLFDLPTTHIFNDP